MSERHFVFRRDFRDGADPEQVRLVRLREDGAMSWVSEGLTPEEWINLLTVVAPRLAPDREAQEILSCPPRITSSPSSLRNGSAARPSSEAAATPVLTIPRFLASLVAVIVAVSVLPAGGPA